MSSLIGRIADNLSKSLEKVKSSVQHLPSEPLTLDDTIILLNGISGQQLNGMPTLARKIRGITLERFSLSLKEAIGYIEEELRFYEQNSYYALLIKKTPKGNLGGRHSISIVWGTPYTDLSDGFRVSLTPHTNEIVVKYNLKPIVDIS